MRKSSSTGAFSSSSDDSWVTVTPSMGGGGACLPEAEPPSHDAEPPSPAPAPPPLPTALPSPPGRPAAADGAVLLAGIPEHDTIGLDRSTLGILAHLTSRALSDPTASGSAAAANAPVDIVAAVDCSSSIRNAMDLIRRTMTFVTSELRPCDRLSIVCYVTPQAIYRCCL